MPDRIFVDTNILVYAHDVSAGVKNITAKQLIQELWVNKSGCLSIQVMQEFFVAVTQKVPNPMDQETAVRILGSLRYWTNHEPAIDDCIHAVDIQKQYQISFWDAMILQSTSQLDCDHLWSENLNSGQVYQGVEIVNPVL